MSVYYWFYGYTVGILSCGYAADRLSGIWFSALLTIVVLIDLVIYLVKELMGNNPR